MNILGLLDSAKNKGRLLEEVVEVILVDQGFEHVARQKSGSQYGFDVIGYKNEKCWKVECKNLKYAVGINDAAPKLVWHFDQHYLSKFILVSTNGISNDLRHLLEQRMFSFDVQIWTGEYLERLIAESPKAKKLLGIDLNSYLIQNQSAQPLEYTASKLRFDVVYNGGRPYCYDYLIHDKELLKAYEASGYELLAILDNRSSSRYVIAGINVITCRHINTSQHRVLRQQKPKGLRKTTKLKFKPSTIQNDSVRVELNGILEVDPASAEYVEFELSEDCQTGYYEIMFELTGFINGKQVIFRSQMQTFHKAKYSHNICSLQVTGKHYDEPSRAILELDTKTWFKLKKSYPKYLKFLGPTYNEVPLGSFNSSTWQVRLLKGVPFKDGKMSGMNINPDAKVKLLYDLGLEITEHIHTVEDSWNAITGKPRGPV